MNLPLGFQFPTTLYALTLSQPWPRMFLLLDDPKRLENRMWQPKPDELRPGQWFALHGGRPPKSAKEFDDCLESLDWINAHVWGGEGNPVDWAYPEDILEASVTGLFALAQYRGVTTARGQLWRTTDRFGWQLGDLVPLPRPVPCRGHKDLWPVTGAELREVRQQLGLSGMAIHAAQAPPVQVMAQSPPIGGNSDIAKIPGRMCAGIPVRQLPDRPESGRMYGLRVGDDWVSVICKRSKDDDSEVYSWAWVVKSGHGEGSRRAFEAALRQQREVAA